MKDKLILESTVVRGPYSWLTLLSLCLFLLDLIPYFFDLFCDCGFKFFEYVIFFVKVSKNKEELLLRIRVVGDALVDSEDYFKNIQETSFMSPDIH